MGGRERNERREGESCKLVFGWFDRQIAVSFISLLACFLTWSAGRSATDRICERSPLGIESGGPHTTGPVGFKKFRPNFALIVFAKICGQILWRGLPLGIFNKFGDFLEKLFHVFGSFWAIELRESCNLSLKCR